MNKFAGKLSRKCSWKKRSRKPKLTISTATTNNTIVTSSRNAVSFDCIPQDVIISHIFTFLDDFGEIQALSCVNHQVSSIYRLYLKYVINDSISRMTSCVSVEPSKGDFLPTISKPSPRHSSSCCTIGSQKSMLLFGGVSDTNKLLNDLFCYTHVNQSWKKLETSNVPTPRSNAALTCISPSCFILFGGRLEQPDATDLTYVLTNQRNNDTWTWREIETPNSILCQNDYKRIATTAVGTTLYVLSESTLYSLDTQNTTFQWKTLTTSNIIPSSSYSLHVIKNRQQLLLYSGTGQIFLYDITSNSWVEKLCRGDIPSRATSDSITSATFSTSSCHQNRLFVGQNEKGSTWIPYTLDLEDWTWNRMTPQNIDDSSSTKRQEQQWCNVGSTRRFGNNEVLIFGGQSTGHSSPITLGGLRTIKMGDFIKPESPRAALGLRRKQSFFNE